MLILLPIAFISGILTVFSPCALLILPIVLVSGIDGNGKKIKRVIVGLVISFTITLLFLATIVRAIGIPTDTVKLFTVGLLIIFGLNLIFPKLWQKIQNWIEKKWHFHQAQNKNKGFGGGFITGISFGIIWTLCIGPVVATLTTTSSFSFLTILITLAYALGAGLTLYFIAKESSKISQKLSFVKKENQKIRQVFGVIILATALFVWSRADRSLQAWTLNNLPDSWTQITSKFENKVDVNSQLKQLQKRGEASKTKSKQTIINNVKLQNNFNGAKVAKKDLVQGCFAKDCIPSIDKPNFENVTQADSWLNPDDRVFAINFKGKARAYPQRIMNWHEIVNDEIENTPIAITFCPLCGSALAFERSVNGITTEFGVSGKLHNSDLVMYDRYEGNLWQQVTGEAIVGPAALRNEKLVQIPITTATWSKWKQKHPDTQVLSRDTGFTRNYNQYPYGTYEKDDELLFGVKGLDKSLQIKTPVYGIEIDKHFKAYPESIFKTQTQTTDRLGDVTITIKKQESGEIIVTRNDTGENIVPIRLFWFAWAAFHPDTEIYQAN